MSRIFAITGVGYGGSNDVAGSGITITDSGYLASNYRGIANAG